MFIIVSTTPRYRGQLIGKDALVRSNTIGHEIHITRPLLFFLLSKNKISVDDIIVTKSKERFFFYSKIFKYILEYDEMPENIPERDILDLTQSNTLIEDYEKDFLLDMEIKIPILHELRTQKVLVQTDLFQNYLSSFDFPDIDFDFLSTRFVVIHYRQVSYEKLIVYYNNHELNDVDVLQIQTNMIKVIIKIIMKYYPELTIVVFSIKPIDYIHEKVKYVSKIPIYASLMNHPNCQSVISTFSGAGQLSHYCHHKNIIYYFNEYFFTHNNNLDELMEKANSPNNMYLQFDLKKNTKSNLFIYKKYYDLICNLVMDNLIYTTNNQDGLPLYKFM